MQSRDHKSDPAAALSSLFKVKEVGEDVVKVDVRPGCLEQLSQFVSN